MSTLLTMLDALDDLPQALELRERTYELLGTMADGDWLDEQTDRARDDRLFVAVPMFLVAGTRVD